MPSTTTPWGLTRSTLAQRRLVELERLCFTALTSPLFRKKTHIHRETRFLTLQVTMAKGDSYYAYNLARTLLLNNLDNSRVWNLFIQVIMKGDDIRHNRFLMRLMMKHPGCPFFGQFFVSIESIAKFCHSTVHWKCCVGIGCALERRLTDDGLDFRQRAYQRVERPRLPGGRHVQVLAQRVHVGLQAGARE